jgi:hypothetical protein
MRTKHTEERGCICRDCCEERVALNELRRQRSIEILEDRYVLHPSWSPSRTSGAAKACECCANLEIVKRTITGYMEHRNG